MNRVALPWPHKDLSANARIHWTRHHRAKSRARSDAFILCREAKVPYGHGAVLRFTYHPPDRRRRDAQNLPGMLKAAIDGIADAIGCDDSAFTCIFPGGFGEVRKGGEIVVEIEVDTG